MPRGVRFADNSKFFINVSCFPFNTQVQFKLVIEIIKWDENNFNLLEWLVNLP